MNELISMGGYAPFIWSSYGFFFITIITLFITNFLRLKKREEVLNKINNNRD